jgi:peptide/nickel transport system substrate-binding protein
MRVSRGFSVLLGLALVTVGTSAAAASTDRAAGPQRGGTMTIIKSAEQSGGQDPIFYLGHPSPATQAGQDFAIYDALFMYDSESLKLVPRLATSMTTSDGGTTWTLKLRPNVKFSDGTTFDAAAVQFNWQRIADPANKSPNISAANVVQAYQVVDPTTLRVTLKSADPNWNQTVASKLAWIGSPTAIKAEGAGFGAKPVGAGPFILKEWVRDDHYTFVRNPNYWEKGRPYLDEVDFKVITDTNAAYNTFKSGAANLFYLYDPLVAGQAQQDGYKEIPWIPNGGGQSLTMNNAKAPFNDVRVRQAVDLALDREAFNKTRRFSSKQFLMTSIDLPGSPFYDKNIAVPKYDLAAAQKLIDQVVQETGKPVSFTLNAFTTPYLSQDAELVQAQLAKLKNVDVKLETLASSVGIARYTGGDYQVFYLGSPRWSEPTTDFYSSFFTGNSQNTARYSNPTVDAWLTQLKTAADQKTRVQLVHDVEKQVLKDAPVVWYTRIVHYQVLDKSVQDYVSYSTDPLLDSVWIKSKR